ncbi:MAG TPA: carboxypeptidase regulatory-like domain-containing protein [Bryobacteraceae bacterium]|nr:carboxypeptidase regulatory-like domain-containing protein [Bryobacteraceae bacterium]
MITAVRRAVMAALPAIVSVLFVQVLPAQSIISGDITGTVTDPSGASLPGATVVLNNSGTGATQSATTNAQGLYRFALIPPGTYNVSVAASGFRRARQTRIMVQAGQSATANFQLTLASETQTVEVTEHAPGVQTTNADTTTNFSANQILNMPNPGGDMTYIAQTAPGVVMNTQSGYGNFSANGMPGTSNLFSVNGQNFNDPFLSLNNSGASNLLLGFNDIAEANVITNAYSAQYGQYAGSQVTYITKTGNNQFHGDAIWMWNGRALNADDFFSNSVGFPRPFDNFNQWATDVNGPIWKNHTFFDVDYEGVREVLPTASTLVLVPSQQFQAATLANLSAVGNSAEIPFYKQLFGVYNGAPGVSSAIPATTSNGGCGDFTLLGAGVPCAMQFRTTAPNKLTEYQWAARVDQNIGNNDHAYVRVFRDNGFQPTFTSPFGPTFNDQSNQPQMSAQAAENHTFNATTVNQFNASGLFYSAAFLPSNAAAANTALPAMVAFAGGQFTETADQPFFFPQGRRVFQYQIIDDLSKVIGNHTFRVGISALHDDITDLGFGQNTQGALTIASLQEFYNGGGPNTLLTQNFPNATEQPFGLRTLGGYVADDWKVNDRLTVSLNLRLENYGNPSCGHNCFSRLATPFDGGLYNADTAYNQAIAYDQHNAFANTQAVVWEPRIGIAWRPFRSHSTVIRTGAGIFADELPGFLAENAAFNPPGLTSFTVANGNIAPGVPGSLFGAASQANQAFLSQFASGGNLGSILQATNGAFVPPNIFGFPNTFDQPTYYKWNFEVQHELGWSTLLSVNYNGMHGIHIPIDDNGLNAYCPLSACTAGFTGLPAGVPDAMFGVVNQVLSAGTSNYNGLTVSLRRAVSSGLTFNLNYTWSHALDDVSNGGLLPLNALQTDTSLLNPQNPFNIRANYGDSDLDVRHYVSFGWVYTDVLRRAGFHWGPNRVFGGWALSGNMFYRTGLPFTVIDTNATTTLGGFNYGGTIFGTPVTNSFAGCGSGAVNVPCLNTSEFLASTASPTGFGAQARNDFRGPGFFDMDLSLMKEFAITERLKVSIGAQAYNLLNHPNFDQPVNDIANPQFGTITRLVGPPTSILGSFVAGNDSPRFVELKAEFHF